jgi:hypothetical protein
MAGTGAANLSLRFSRWRLRQAGDPLPAFLEALVERDGLEGKEEVLRLAANLREEP